MKTLSQIVAEVQAVNKLQHALLSEQLKIATEAAQVPDSQRRIVELACRWGTPATTSALGGFSFLPSPVDYVCFCSGLAGVFCSGHMVTA